MATGRIEEAVAHDADWPVRARAAELASGLPDALVVLVGAARDPEPRVREAALEALSSAPNAPPDAVRAGVDALQRDGWWFVKARAVAMLANAPASHDVDDALGGALHDPSVVVRGGAIVALARRRAVPWRATIRERLDDTGEDPEVRAAAARALGALCDPVTGAMPGGSHGGSPSTGEASRGAREGGKGFRARFRCVLALVDPFTGSGGPRTVEGVCEGTVTRAPRGSGGFGYDPLFVVAGTDRTMAELAEQEKNRLSHRARAFAALRPLLEGVLRERAGQVDRVDRVARPG